MSKPLASAGVRRGGILMLALLGAVLAGCATGAKLHTPPKRSAWSWEAQRLILPLAFVWCKLCVFLVVSGLALACGVRPAYANTLIVAPAAVITAIDSQCSLREAIQAANTDTMMNECPAGSVGPDTIELAAASTYTLPAFVEINNGQNGLPSITSTITINGNGATVRRNPLLPCTGASEFRVFRVVGNLTLNDLTVSNGCANGTGNLGQSGGGILNGGTLIISNSTIKDNFAGSGGQEGGGGIWNAGTLTISNSTVSGNSTLIDGGGIWSAGTLTISDSTLSGNSAQISGGGIFNGFGPGTVMISNSTLSGNSAADGGGIFTDGGTTISNSTLFGNSALKNGGGIFDVKNTVNIKSSIVANSPSGADCFGGITSTGVNFDTDTTCGSGFTTATLLLLNLGTLTVNPPGNTPTHALLPSSVAVDAASDCTDFFSLPVNQDQRGVSRPQGSACDVGAYEKEEEKGRCDLVVGKSLAHGIIPPLQTGQQAIFEIVVTNVGPGSCAPFIPVTETFAGMTYQSGGPPPSWLCPTGPSTNPVTCDYSGTLQPGQSFNFFVTFTVDAKPGEVVKNCAVVMHPEDTNKCDNEVCIEGPVVKPAEKCDLEIKKEVKPHLVAPGGAVTIKLTLTNVGTAHCGPDTVVQDPPTKGLTVPSQMVAISQPGGSAAWSCSVGMSIANGVTCVTASTLPAGYSAMFTFTGTASASAGGTIPNCATVNNFSDTDPANNQSCVSIHVSTPPPLEPTAVERKRLRRSWAQLVRRIYEVEPLVCRECGADMRILAFILDPPVIRRILHPLGKKRSLRQGDRPRAGASPR